MDKKRLRYPVIVEGKYDKIKLDSIFDARIYVSGGFGIFNSKERQALFERIAKGGVILLTDSDGGGVQIRSFLRSILPPDRIYNAYIPSIAGKEKRKQRASRSGMLGVEGMSREVIERALAPFIVGDGEDGSDDGVKAKSAQEMLTTIDFFRDGLTGADGSGVKRDALCELLGLPPGMSAKALLEAINLISDREEYTRLVGEL
ncbi:MAG: DUF4093 domain-containing protein [Clostridia bacterium]|nr:DUF4093 domain-containing protein [Clostridia bacterium]